MKSLEKHRKDGTYTTHRHGKKLEAAPVKTPPEPPADLPKAARKIWVTEVKELFALRTIADKDLPALRELVMNVYYMGMAEANLEKDGLVIVADLKAGKKHVTNPAWRVFQDAQKVVIALRKEFGVTPLSGQRFAKPEEDKPYDPALERLNRLFSQGMQ